LKKFICALEGVSTGKILRKKVNYFAEKFIDENGNFYADEDGVKKIF
jgi:hypothetical protein